MDEAGNKMEVDSKCTSSSSSSSDKKIDRSASIEKLPDLAILKLPDYCDDVNRLRLRFGGFGARVNNDPRKEIWPQSIKPEEEANKAFYPELVKFIDNPGQVQKLKRIICNIFTHLRRCNMKRLLDRCCPIDRSCRRGQPDVVDMMQAFTTHNQLLNFLHQILRSIKIDNTPGNHLTRLFGSNRNFDIYKQHLKWFVIANSKFKTMLTGYFVHYEHMSMDLEQVLWLDVGLNQEAKYRVFMQTISRINWFIAQTLRRYFYITTSNPYGHKLFHYRHDLWQRLQAHVINMHKSSQLFEEVRLDTTKIPLEHTSKIRFHLKRDDLRLICTNPKVHNYNSHYQLKAALEYIVKNMPHSEKYRSPHDLLDGIKYMQRLSRESRKKVYVIRADMQNCFHSIDQMRLKSIIVNFLRSSFSNGMLKFYKLECTLNTVRPVRTITKWSLDPESEKRREKYQHVQVVGSPENVGLARFEQDLIAPLIIRPILLATSKSKLGYRLMSGIRQGSRASPVLCGIYIRAAFNDSIQDILNSDDSMCFFHVDDILLMTTCPGKAEKFLDTMINGIADFRLKSNANKLAINFHSRNHNVHQLDGHVQFYKRKVDLETLSCSYSYSTEGVGIENLFTVHPYMNEEKIRAATRIFTKIDGIFLDFEINGPERVFSNIFECALFVAYRIVTLINASFVLRNHATQRPKFIEKLVKLVSKKLFSCLDAAIKNNLVENSMNYNEFHLIVLAAFVVTWQTNKVRHRAVERKFLERRLNRHMMRYLVFHPESNDESEIRGIHFEARIRSLIGNFPTSSFNRLMLLPNKY